MIIFVFMGIASLLVSSVLTADILPIAAAHNSMAAMSFWSGGDLLLLDRLVRSKHGPQSAAYRASKII
ncbi:hypothetical protein [Aurantimonas sp. 22II-16-19i]|uniref:hypothetical protein n=1 Tax=Aurantimonas sp. 22II-16-19i TaxID=1317114 RepID=UPI00111C91AB|nr:hypothetical protein [Aurantimonas sp. 22II-16-19i]